MTLIPPEGCAVPGRHTTNDFTIQGSENAENRRGWEARALIARLIPCFGNTHPFRLANLPADFQSPRNCSRNCRTPAPATMRRPP